MTLLYPRLARELARPRIGSIQGKTIQQLIDQVTTRLPDHTYAPIGGQQATETDIQNLRDHIHRIASECGFPDRPTIDQRVLFDGRAGRALHERMQITPHQASDEEIWTHLTLGPLLDIAGWRFEALTDDHLIGRGPRSTFRRLWWRAEVLGPYSWDENHPLREDETVQVMERADLTANPTVARALTRAFLRRIQADPHIDRMNLMRDALKRAVRLNPFLRWEALTLDQLEAVINNLFHESAVALLAPDRPHPLLDDPNEAPEPDPSYHAATDALDPVEHEPTVQPLTPTAQTGPAGAPVSADFVDGAHVGGANGRSAKGAFEDTPLAAVPLLLRQAVASRGTVPDGELVDCFCSHHGMTIQRRHHRLFSKLAWSALGRGVLSKDDDGTWSAGPHDGVIDQFGMWTYRQLYARAQELLTDDPEPFERLIVEVTGRDRGQRVVASVIGTAINEAQKSR